jgi:hypothetical protein
MDSVASPAPQPCIRVVGTMTRWKFGVRFLTGSLPLRVRTDTRALTDASVEAGNEIRNQARCLPKSYLDFLPFDAPYQ